LSKHHRTLARLREQVERHEWPAYLAIVPLLPLYGHAATREHFRRAFERGSLPASLLLQGPRGIGKQQLALWLGRFLLCESADRSLAPCGKCKACRMALDGHHPDLQWFFPRPRLKGGDPDVDDIREDIAEGIEDRLRTGLYEPAGGDEAIFVATVRAIVQIAAISPALARRKVFVIGDAERMVAQEGSDQAANAFLKLLEEPPEDTTIILTSSEPGALLPTVRSRVVGIRIPPLSRTEMSAFLADPVVAKQLDSSGSRGRDELIEVAGGAPGRLMDSDAWRAALAEAKRFLDAARAPDRGQRMKVALSQGGAGARGRFSETLDALTVLLHDRSRDAARAGDTQGAGGAARAVEIVEEIKEQTLRNVNPQLLTASLLRRIAPLVA
jgi:DNA polymerase-3 subunit delta'